MQLLPPACALVFVGFLQAVAASPPLTLETPHFRYTLSPAGVNLGFVDRASGLDYLRPGAPSPAALVRRGGQEYPLTTAALAGDRLTFGFGAADLEVVLKVDHRPEYLRLTVESLKGEAPDSLVFVQVPLRLAGKPEEPFGACAFSLNLFTRVDQLPALQTELRAACHRKFGLVGAQVALVAAPPDRMLAVLRDVLTDAKDLPPCPVAGPWAVDVPFNHGSYLFNFGDLTETNVADWIAMVQSLGFTQIDHHGGGGFFRFGDFELNRRKWPEGWETFARIVARLRAAGIGSIFHSYAFFIAKDSKYVTPVPDPRLDAFRTFTLAEALAADARELVVNEPTAGLSTITGFFEHNSVVLHLGDELVTFAGVSQAPPWRFTGLQRGAHGTRAAAHPAGSTARHLKECFGLFVPDPESSLFEEIAANHADIVNRCGFDGIYLDAIDGSSILRGADECWYWADKFVFAIQKRLQRPVGMEMSAMWHHFWQYRTRWQAWDYPQRGHRRFVDLHADTVNGGLLLPLHLGWWNFQSWNPPQIEPTFPEVVEHLGARLIGWDAGISLTGAVNRDRLRQVPLFRRAVDILRTTEELRRAGTYDAAARAGLREPNRTFTLVTDGAGKARFHHAHNVAHTAAVAEPWTLAWTAANPFAPQALKFRLEVLMGTGAYDGPEAVVLADFAEQDLAAWKPTQAAGVVSSVAREPAEGGSAREVAVLEATSSGQVPRNAAWARWQRAFAPSLNLKQQPALGLWVEGDGLGELLAFRLESPRHLAYGAVADRYLPVDFTGRRLVTLLESESTRWSDFEWNDGKGLYQIYRETVDFGAIGSVSVGFQNLPPGKTVRCRVGPVHALPMQPCTIRQPALTVNGVTVVFPAELSSGSWLESQGSEEGVVYGPTGERLATVPLTTPLPMLRTGENRLAFTCVPAEGATARVKVTVFSQGDPL